MTRPAKGFRGVVWLDRDGTVVDDPGYLDDPAALVLLPRAASAIARLQRAGVAVVLITNQSGIARGLMDRATVDAIHEELGRLLAEEGAALDGVYLCPHLPPALLPEGETPCDCRKPSPGLVLRAREEMGLEGLPSVVVGDKSADLELGAALGLPAMLVLTGEGENTTAALAEDGRAAEHAAEDLAAGVDWILRRLGVEA